MQQAYFVVLFQPIIRRMEEMGGNVYGFFGNEW